MSVYKAIAAVMGDLAKSGISKEQTNTYDKYKFRGIDDVYNALAPLLAKHGLLILPRVLERHSEERASKENKAVFYITVKVEFDFVSATDGSKHTICAYGEAMDRGDKGTNKAMTAAYKYACFEAFCIPTEGADDADSETHEVEARITPTAGVWESLGEEEREFLAREASRVIELLGKGDAIDAVRYVEGLNLDTDEKVALWTRFDSKQRSAMKKAALKEAA